jgi:hypothetical protein
MRRLRFEEEMKTAGYKRTIVNGTIVYVSDPPTASFDDTDEDDAVEPLARRS